MDGRDQTMVHNAIAYRPAIGFPLGTALLIVVVFSLSGIFSCCYHRDQRRSDDTSTVGTVFYPSKSAPADVNSKQNHTESLPVLMPGDRVPKYIAWPCPCNPSQPEKIIIDVQTQPLVPLPA